MLLEFKRALAPRGNSRVAELTPLSTMLDSIAGKTRASKLIPAITVVEVCEQDICGMSSAFEGLSRKHGTAAYKYQPLSNPDSFRILELIPGEPDETIRISLHRQSLSALPIYALSYEWGETFRLHVIIRAEKSLKVTINLLTLLKRLRSPEGAGIFTICIIQYDLAERSEQVPLMRDIYQKAQQVLVWLGEERPYTGEAIQTIPRLAEALDSLGIASENFKTNVIKDPSGMSCGACLTGLTSSLVWAGLVDLLPSRSYFSRLWVVQEIVLASNAAVLCGSHRIDWNSFQKAARLIWHGEFLYSKDFSSKGSRKLAMKPVLAPLLQGPKTKQNSDQWANEAKETRGGKKMPRRGGILLFKLGRVPLPDF
jgi:hypothetical protein